MRPWLGRQLYHPLALLCQTAVLRTRWRSILLLCLLRAFLLCLPRPGSHLLVRNPRWLLLANGPPPLQPTLVELGHSTSGFFADLALASGFSYAFFSFGDSAASASLCHEDAFSALLRCAFSGVVSVMVAHIFDLEAGPLGDRLLHRLCQLLLATFLGGGHILLFMHSASGLWTQRATRSLLLEARAALTVLPLCGFGSACHDELLLASSLECFGSLAGTCRHTNSASTLACSIPSALCQGIVSRLGRSNSLSGSPALLSLDALVALRPVKQARDLPIASQDGGGIHSKPDWSVPPSSASGIFSAASEGFPYLHFAAQSPQAPSRSCGCCFGFSFLF